MILRSLHTLPLATDIIIATFECVCVVMTRHFIFRGSPSSKYLAYNQVREREKLYVCADHVSPTATTHTAAICDMVNMVLIEFS